MQSFWPSKVARISPIKLAWVGLGNDTLSVAAFSNASARMGMIEGALAQNIY